MRKPQIIIGILLGVVLLVLGACGPAVTEEEETVPPEEVVTEEEEVVTEEEVTIEEPVTEVPAKEDPQKNGPPPADTGDVIRLYYYGPSALGVDPAKVPGPHNIYSATSNDGINFREDLGVRFSYDTGAEFGITDSDVICLNDGSWLMFLSLGTQLLKATSPTSSGTFTLDNSFNWVRGGVPGSYNFNGTVRTFVCYQGGIHMATYDQNNGTLNYTGVALNPPSSGMIADPSVIKVGNEYFMFYKYASSHTAPPGEHEIYLATSADGITWSQHAQNKFICKGSVPGAVYYNGTIYVYYCGLAHKPGAPPVDMGVAISQDNGVTFTTSTITIQGRTAAGTVDPAAVVVSTHQR